MDALQLATNLNCANCVARVSAQLDRIAGPDGWKVDTAVPEKILTVTAPVPADAVIEAIEDAGFSAKLLPAAVR